MKATIIVLLVLTFIFIYIGILRLMKKTQYYRRILKLYEQAKKTPSRISGKGDVRRHRKYRPYLKAFKRQFIIFMVINTSMFLGVYAALILVSTMLAYGYLGLLIESPVLIPFFTLIEDNKVYIHYSAVVITALLATIYPVSKELKLEAE